LNTIISGSRSATREQVFAAIRLSGFSDRITRVLSGKCKTGGDFWGEQWALVNRIPVDPFKADWDDLAPLDDLGVNQYIEVKGGHQYDKAAGKRRNEQMALVGDAIIATWDGMSPGTSDMITRAHSHGLVMFILLTNPNSTAAWYLEYKKIPFRIYKEETE
jgi:hypothetical protein